MRYSLMAVVFIAAMASAAQGSAHTGGPLRGDVGVEIVSDNGTKFFSIPWQESGNGATRTVKQYLEARKGERYGIVIKNNSPERVGVVIAVDGRNIISGKKSDLGRREMMYLVNAYEHAKYNGWRTTDNEVHRFYFTSPSDSYSKKTFGDASAMGVIAVAVYREKERPRPMIEERKNEIAPSAPSAESAARGRQKTLADHSAGTGFGESQYSPVIIVEFEPERTPVQKTLVKYEWRETLCRKGLLRCGQGAGNRLWDQNEYARYPPGYGDNRQ